MKIQMSIMMEKASGSGKEKQNERQRDGQTDRGNETDSKSMGMDW